MIATIDALISPTLKHLREHWWTDEFTEFLVETLRPRAGNRILDVGCGEGLAEVAIGRRHVSQVRLHGIDLVPAKVAEARRVTQSHNQRVAFCAGDAGRLPFRDAAFDSTFCVAVLQYVHTPAEALAEIARVTVGDGRIVVVEPDNGARYAHSSLSTGRRAFEAAGRFFDALGSARGEATDPSIGPKVPTYLAGCGVDVLDVRLFPISHVQLGRPDEGSWAARLERVDALFDISPTNDVRALAVAYREALEAYRREAESLGDGFVEIQHTTLFATVGQKRD
jgi:SAM-dependent methyltransferase